MNLEEALAASIDNTELLNDDIITIDNNLRTMNIPDSMSILGVESDESVNRLKFRLPRYYCGIDLSEFSIYVNYLNSRTEDVYMVTDKVVNNDYIDFSWLVGRNASKDKGVTKFVLCLKKSDSSGTVVKEFNTTIHELKVLEGLETNADTSQIVNNRDLNDLVDQIKLLIDLEGEKVISNLPKDYQELLKDVKSLKDEVKNTMPYYPIATEAQARAGVDDTVMMTPLKVAMACEEFGGSGSGGGGNVNIATLSSGFTGGSYAYGLPIDIRYRFASPSTGNGTLHVLVDSIETINESIPQGTNRTTLNDLSKGNHTIVIYVVDSAGTFTDTLSFSVRIGTLDITSNFDDSVDFNIVNVIKVPITIDTISIDPIYLVQTIDGIETRLSAENGYNIIVLPTMSAGAHKVSFHAESGSYKSQTLSYNIVIEDADSLTLITDFNIRTIEYKDMLEIPYRVSMKGQTKFTAEYSVDDVVVKRLEIPSGTNVWSTNTLEIGNHTIKITVSTLDSSKTNYIEKNIIVQERDYTPMEPVKDASLLCWFDATGRTNQDIDKDTWTDKSGNNVNATLHNFNFSTNGWEDNALKCNGQSYVEIGLKALADNAPYGMTVDVRYNTRDVGAQDACVLDMRGSDVRNKGFAIDTEYMYMNSASTSVKSVVEQDTISKATFVIDRENKIAKIYNNGVLTETFLMTDTENFSNDTKIYLGAKLESVDSKWIPNVFGNCEIYSFRVYARALDSEEIVKNFVADIPDMDKQQEKYLLNYENSMPTMYFYGDTSAMTKENRVPLRIKYISGNADEYGASFDLENCQVGWQGTSSLQYAVKNYKIKLKNPDGSKYKYSPFKNGILEDTFCLKADYMESSHANNTGMAKFINNELYDSKIPPQETNDKIRTTINGFPIQLYIAKDTSSKPEYMGVFNFNLDKGCNKSFGLDNETYEQCMSFEVSSNSDTSAGAFKDDSDESLRTDFELRYPDEDDCTDEEITVKYNTLKRLVSWVKNATEETFKNELEQYFNKEYLLKYFLQVHLFGMVDNLGKNMMLTTWDGNIWYPEFYDMDTQLGLDNTGYLKFYSDIDITEGVYNTSGSKLWSLVQTVFADELKTMYKQMRASTYRSETIMKYWYDEQVAKIGELQYNKDMEAKYIKFKNDYLFMLHGRRSEHARKWIEERLLYLDTIYGYEENTRDSITIRANTTSTINLDILTYSPQYLTVRWRNGVEQRLKIGRDSNGMMQSTRFSGSVATATDQEIIIYNAKQIKKIGGLNTSNPGTLNLVEASRLVEVDCRNSRLLNDIRLNDNNKFISRILLSGCSKLGDTSTGKSSTLDLSMFPMLTEVTFNDTMLTNVIFPTTGCNLKTLNAASEKLQSLVLKNMPVLKELQTSARSSFSEFAIENCPEVVILTNISHSEPACIVHSENILIDNCPKIFSNVYAFGININDKYSTSPIETLKSIVIKNCGETKLSVLKIRGSWESYTGLHLEKIEIDCNIGLLMMFGVGFKEKQTLNIDSTKIDFLMLKKFSNIGDLNITSNLKGIYLASANTDDGIWDIYSNGCWRSINSYGTSRETKNYSVGPRIDNLYIDGELITDTVDFRHNPKMSVLVLDQKVIPESITKAIVNCDFTLIDSDINVSSFILMNDVVYLQWQFYLPVSFEVEGYIKYSKDVKSWYVIGDKCSNTDTQYIPLENFENLTVDYSEIKDCSRLFMNCKNLKVLPDSLTPEIFNRGNITNAFYNCTSLADLNNLEGADISIELDESYTGDTANSAFRNTKGPFTLGDVIINALNSTAAISNMFWGSGITSIGNVTINVKTPNISGFFQNCMSLRTVEGFNTVDGSNMSNMFDGCTSIETWENIKLPNNANLSCTFANSNLKIISELKNYKEAIRSASNLSSCFYKSKITNVPDLIIENAIAMTSMFFNCELLETVENIIVTTAANAQDMFRKDINLRTIKKIDFNKAANVFYIFESDTNITDINSLDISYFTINVDNRDSRIVASPSLTNIGFKGTLGKYFEYTSIARSNPLNLASITSMIECLETLTSPQTLRIHGTSFALLTEELISKATDKNWTLVSA